MIRQLLTVAAFVGIAAATPTSAAPCKDAKGKFVKCPPAAAQKTATKANVTKDAKGKCHIASGPKKGQFTKC
jgi:nitrous oxide reductase